MKRVLHLLCLIDADEYLVLLKRALDRSYDLTIAQIKTLDELKVTLTRRLYWDIIIADSPKVAATAAYLKELSLELPLIALLDTDDETDALNMISAGAQDFIPKDRPTRLAPIIERELRTAVLKADYQRASERLQEQALLIDTVHDAIIVRDLNREILCWNRGAERTYGWTAAEVLGKKVSELIYKELSLEFQEAEQTTLSQGEWRGELQQRTRDGAKITVESHWRAVYNQSGNIRAYLISNLDITDKKKLAAQFLHAQRMENIGTLAGGIAHDLNNVLAPIMMSIQILRRKYPDTDSQRLLTTLETSAARGADMVKQVLSFVRGVQGERVTINVKYLIGDLEKILNQTLNKTITVDTTVEENVWPVAADATQLYQVLMNLAINARDAMPRGGKLTIKAENFFLDDNYVSMDAAAKYGEHILITITDTGNGIPAGSLDKIFDPFYTTKETGTGLGLSTVASIVKSHGGFINVYSEPGKGTQFKIYLPAVDTPQLKLNDPESSLPMGNGELILVVDDEVSIREITRETLESCGYQVIVAGDGTEAIALYAGQREKIALVLLDMMMPYMDGATTIRALQKLDPEVRIIAASGLSLNSYTAEAGRCGAQAFLTKPYTAKSLLETVAQLIK